MFEDRTAIQGLRKLGIRGLDPGVGPNKDTDTTYRYKFGVMTGGDVRYPTKVEVSFRGRCDEDEILTSQPSPEVVRPYLGENFSLVLSHYGRNGAVRQKVLALAVESIPKLVETRVTSGRSGCGMSLAIGMDDPEFLLNRGTERREVAIAE